MELNKEIQSMLKENGRISYITENEGKKVILFNSNYGNTFQLGLISLETFEEKLNNFLQKNMNPYQEMANYFNILNGCDDDMYSHRRASGCDFIEYVDVNFNFKFKENGVKNFIKDNLDLFFTSLEFTTIIKDDDGNECLLYLDDSLNSFLGNKLLGI